MQAAGAGAGGLAGSAGDPDRQAGLGGQGGAVGVAAAAADGGHRVPQAQYVPGPGGAATAAAGRPGGRLYVFVLSVPFPSPLEAEIACASLAADAEPHRVVVHKHLIVRGSILGVHWRAEDSRLLRVSVVNFLDQLSLVMRTLQRFGPPVSH